MSWSDILYPDNAKRREHLAALCGELKTRLESCFTAVNHLIDCITENVPGKTFETITMQESATVGENCKLIADRVNEIQKYLEQKEYDVKNLLGTDLFEKLINLDTSFEEKFEIARKAVSGSLTITFTVGDIVLVSMIRAGTLFPTLVTRLAKIAASFVASLVLGILVAGVDIIASAIIGAIERAKLEEALTEYEGAVKEFKPAAEEFYDNISMVRSMIKMHKKQ